MPEVKITKNQVIPFIDVSKTINSNTWTPSWKRIDKSTIFDLAFNAQEETTDYICYENAVTEMQQYQPELPQEIALYRGNPVYDFVEEMCRNLSIGADAVVPFLLCWPPDAENVINAWQTKETVLVLSNYQSVEGKITFTLRIGGNIQKGTVTISTGGVPTFTPAS